MLNKLLFVCLVKLAIILNLITCENSSAELRTFTKEELSKYNGEDPNLPIYLAVKGLVYDVSKSSSFYGKGKAYGVFAGKDCTRAVALWSKEEADMIPSLDGLDKKYLDSLEKTINTLYKKKYQVVGKMDYFVDDKPKREL